jgi:hypothetical protein
MRCRTTVATVSGLFLALCSARSLPAEESAWPAEPDFKPLSLTADLTAKPIIRYEWGDGTGEVWALQVRGNHLTQVTFVKHRGRAQVDLLFVHAKRGELGALSTRKRFLQLYESEGRWRNGDRIWLSERFLGLPGAQVLEPGIK